MNIQYQRNLKSSYMVAIEPGQPLNMDGQLAEKMMERQKIAGLLKWVTMEHRGDMTFWYQITGLQSLADFLRHHPLSYALFGHLLGGLLALQEELPRFYLKCEHLVLRTEQIFLDPSGRQAAFCYEPLWQQEPQEALRGLMEELLPLIDHNDKDAVRFGYGLYEKCQEPNADIWRFVLEQWEGREPSGDVQPAGEQESAVRPEPPERAKMCEEPSEDVSGTVKKTQPYALERSFSRAMETLPRRMFEKLPVVSARAWFEDLRKKKKKEEPELTCLFEPKEPETSAHPTVYLGERKMH